MVCRKRVRFLFRGIRCVRNVVCSRSFVVCHALVCVWLSSLSNQADHLLLSPSSQAYRRGFFCEWFSRVMFLIAISGVILFVVVWLAWHMNKYWSCCSAAATAGVAPTDPKGSFDTVN